MTIPPTVSTPRIERMLRELQGSRGETATPADPLRPSRKPTRIPALIVVGGALVIALAAWQAWQLAASYDARIVSEATSR